MSGALTVGAVMLTLNAGLYLAIMVADTIQWLQVAQRAGSWSQPADLFHLPLMLLMAAAVSALPVGLWGCILRRRAAFKRLLGTSAPHGKYPPWGRSLRRHASIPARCGLRSRKPLRPLRWPSE